MRLQSTFIATNHFNWMALQHLMTSRDKKKKKVINGLLREHKELSKVIEAHKTELLLLNQKVLRRKYKGYKERH